MTVLTETLWRSAQTHHITLSFLCVCNRIVFFFASEKKELVWGKHSQINLYLIYFYSTSMTILPEICSYCVYCCLENFNYSLHSARWNITGKGIHLLLHATTKMENRNTVFRYRYGGKKKTLKIDCKFNFVI